MKTAEGQGKGRGKVGKGRGEAGERWEKAGERERKGRKKTEKKAGGWQEGEKQGKGGKRQGKAGERQGEGRHIHKELSGLEPSSAQCQHWSRERHRSPADPCRVLLSRAQIPAHTR